ncbi:hypothetical protein FJK98_27620 [Micromonospora sp. HM134]|uniref:hypothetical protein n=1 Tax=unclassified Micromonospora TaxID=2617518 RepID=UPI0011985E49|nr:MULTISPECIES: hypothetical protein [unclassified Micromonospora]QDY10447.1 hypothetical protein FJK98_27620 [Micromonospora sp. HM134]
MSDDGLSVPVPPADPTRELLIWPDYQRDGSGRTTARRVGLDEKAAQWRATVDAGRGTEERLGRAAPGLVSMSSARGLVVASMLRELAARVRPGFSCGPVRSDGSLSALARELADDLRRRTDR